MKQLILINVGNTNTSIARFDGSAVSLLKTVPSGELSPSDLPVGFPIAGISVVPEVMQRLNGRDIFWLTTQCRTNLTFQVDPSTLGGDRLANAMELAAAHPLPGVVVDCGTAITFEVVDAGRILLGGAIAPGRLLMRRALQAGTAQLPMTDLTSRLPAAIGADTRAAIAAGVDLGAVGMVREILTHIGCSFPGGLATVVIAGGDAGFFQQAIPGSVAAGGDFTLNGLRRAWEMNFCE